MSLGPSKLELILPSAISFPSNTDIHPDALWAKMVRGGGWLLLLRVIERSLGVGRIVVLARLLAPDDFGPGALPRIDVKTCTRLPRSARPGAYRRNLSIAPPYKG